MPRYMQRLREIETEYLLQRSRLESVYLELAEDCGPDAGAFATRWRAAAGAWRFDSLNELIREHNAWYPIEASLPMDPRSRDYVPVRGASYRRLELGPDWVLEQLPPRRGPTPPRLPLRAPREPLP